ncbi:MAG: hypothetical protein ACXWPO_03490 [Candidatus Limnocylindrales bacterium]
MAMQSVTPLPVRVRCDWPSGRPKRLRLGDQDVPVLAVARVREESSAYHAARGPLTSFEVVTPATRLVLTFEHRGRRWLVEALDPDGLPLERAA